MAIFSGKILTDEASGVIIRELTTERYEYHEKDRSFGFDVTSQHVKDEGPIAHVYLPYEEFEKYRKPFTESDVENVKEVITRVFKKRVEFVSEKEEAR